MRWTAAVEQRAVADGLVLERAHMLTAAVQRMRVAMLGEEVAADPEPGGWFYISSGMSGIDAGGHHRFDAVAARLRGAGYKIVSPAEEATLVERRATINGEPHSWSEALSRDVLLISLPSCIGVATFADWTRSRGALLEVRLAWALGRRVCGVVGDALVDLDDQLVAEVIS
jgi:hypothetical protein